jgi:hypothetical protein
LEFGTSNGDYASGITTDSTGNLYITGFTTGSLDGNPVLGGQDAFVTKISC